MANRKNQNPRRQRSARRDSSIGSLKSDMAATYGIPEESIQVINPNGRAARRDKSVGRLRADYDRGRR